jgi:hypothetical protein
MVGGSLCVLQLLPPLKYDIAEILLKVALNTKNKKINQIIHSCTLYIFPLVTHVFSSQVVASEILI